jgi:hypothetical protein
MDTPGAVFCAGDFVMAAIIGVSGEWWLNYG